MHLATHQATQKGSIAGEKSIARLCKNGFIGGDPEHAVVLAETRCMDAEPLAVEGRERD